MIESFRKVYSFLFLLLFAHGVSAQEMSVKSFRPLENDITANLHGTMVKDRNGKVSALIKVVTTEQGFTFEGGVTGIVKTVPKAGEIWVYVPDGIQRITIRHPKYGVLRDYYFDISIESARTYELILSTPRTGNTEDSDIGANFFVLHPDQPNGAVYIDGERRMPKSDGSVSGLLPYGEHTYRVEVVGFRTEEGKFTIGNERVDLDIHLTANTSTLTLVSPDANGNIYLDGAFKGVGRWTGSVEEGNHVAEVRKEGFQSQPTNFSVEAGKDSTIELTNPLTRNAKLSIKSPIEGAEIFINDELVDTTEWVGELEPAMYLVELRLAGHRSVRETITLQEREERTLTMQSPTPIFGTLSIDSDPSDCDVFFDETLIGQSPGVFSQLMVGTHKLSLTKEGYEPFNTDITIEEGKQQMLTPQLLPISEVNLESLQTKKIGTNKKETVATTNSTLVQNNYSSKKRSRAYLYSILVPGWGDKYVNKKGRFNIWKTIGAYGLIGAGIGANTYGLSQYAQYQQMAYDNYKGVGYYTQDELDSKYELANTYSKMAPMLVGAGAAIWLYDVIWVAVKGHKPQNTSLTMSLDPQDHNSYLSYSITF